MKERIRFEKCLPDRASVRPPISLKFATEKHGGMVHIVPKWQTRNFDRFWTMRFTARWR